MNHTTTGAKTSDVYSPQEIEEIVDRILRIKRDTESLIKNQDLGINSEELVGDDDRGHKASIAATVTPIHEDALKRAQQTIDNCDNALLRIKNDTYGICHKTREIIPKPVMKASPFRTVKDLKD